MMKYDLSNLKPADYEDIYVLGLFNDLANAGYIEKESGPELNEKGLFVYDTLKSSGLRIDNIEALIDQKLLQHGSSDQAKGLKALAMEQYRINITSINGQAHIESTKQEIEWPDEL